MSVYYPEATPVQGFGKIWGVLSIADPAAPSLGSEINAASSVDLSCFIRGFRPGATQNRGTAPRRYCTTAQLEQLGNTSYTIESIRYVYDPQQPDSHADNAAKELLVAGLTLFLVERRGIDTDTAGAASQRVRVHKVRLGEQVPTESGDDEFAEYEIEQGLVYVTPPVDGIIAA